MYRVQMYRDSEMYSDIIMNRSLTDRGFTRHMPYNLIQDGLLLSEFLFLLNNIIKYNYYENNDIITCIRFIILYRIFANRLRKSHEGT